MKKKLLIICLFALFPFITYAEDMAFFRISVSESFLGLDMKGDDGFDFSASNSLFVDVGYRTSLSSKIALTLFYEASYDGPGAKSNSKEGFQARNIDQFVMAKFDFLYSDSLKFFVRPDFFYEFYRLGKNEAWNDGLYNFGRVGLSGGFDWLFSHQLLNASLDFHYFWFPNYSDLTREALYLTVGSQGLPSDSINQNFLQGAFSLSHRIIFSPLVELKSQYRFTLRYYPSLKVDTQNLVHTDADNQFDTTHFLSLQPIFTLSKEFYIAPTYQFTYFKSNYSYFSVNSFDPFNPDFDFFEDFSSFHSHDFSLPLIYELNPKHSFILEAGIEYKKYLSRPTKKENGKFDLSTKQDLFAFNVGLTWDFKVYDNFTFSVNYLFKQASSNNKDLTAGYNFGVHVISMQMSMEY